MVPFDLLPSNWNDSSGSPTPRWLIEYFPSSLLKQKKTNIFFTSFFSGTECSDIEEPHRFILCYAHNLTLTGQLDLCRCSHLVVALAVNTTQNNGSIVLDEGNTSVDLLFRFPCRSKWKSLRSKKKNIASSLESSSSMYGMEDVKVTTCTFASWLKARLAISWI